MPTPLQTASEPMDDLAGQVIKGYELQERIGAGGFGAVYRAYQPLVARDVAIKIILPRYANHPDFIRRFESEAQLVARLEHAHIVPLYDYWREPDGAYLVMRWLKSGNLRQALKQGRLTPDNLAKILEQITAALSLAHRQGVIHRDLKPDNILLDEEGDAYLADFGIAKDVSRDTMMSEVGILVGSPAYLSPEQVKSEPVTPRSDIYSLGIMLYELLTGEPPYPASTNLFDLLNKHLNEPIPSLSLRRPDLPALLNDVLQRATAKKPESRFPDARSLALAFRQALAPAEGQTASPAGVPGEFAETAVADVATFMAVQTPDFRNPYKGLRAFQEADAVDFFGRQVLIRQLVSRLGEPEPAARFLAVVGPSGSGKSSVVKAGLIPTLRRNALPGSAQWFMVEMQPGAQPFQELEEALLRVAATPVKHVLARLQQDDQGLDEVVKTILPTEEPVELVLVIDQFEELFTALEDEAVRKHFLNSLLAAVLAPDSRLRLIVTLRADFYDRPLLYTDFGELVRRRTEVVLPLTPQELEAAMIGPAQQVGLILEEGLVEAISAEIGEQPGTLPLLQYALTELFERRSGQTLTLDAYHASGGVLGALARRAEELYAGLDESQRQAARQLFLRLVTLGEGTEDTRRRARQVEVTSTSDRRTMEVVIEALGKYRLLTFDHDPQTREPTVEIAHEALMRTWQRLRGWLADSREEIRVQRLVATAAGEWARSRRESSFLAIGARLEQFVEWSRTTSLGLSREERDYIDASIVGEQAWRTTEETRKTREAKIAQRAQNFGRAAVVLAVIGVLSLLAMSVATLQAANAGNQMATATVAQGQAVAQQQTAVVNAAAAQQQVDLVGQTLTPVGPTLTAVYQALQAGSDRLATATVVQGQALQQAAFAQAQAVTATIAQGQAVANQNTAVADIARVAQTLTPVGPTLTAVQNALHAGNDQLATAQSRVAVVGLTLTPAQEQLDRANAFVATAQTEVAVVAQTLAPIPPTLTAVAQKIADGEKQVGALRLVTAANTILQTEGGDTEVAALLSIRALNIMYSPQADDTLMRALSQRNALYNLSGAGQEVAFAPDGRTFATGSSNTLQLWDTISGKRLRKFDGTGPHVAFISNGKMLFTANTSGSVQILDVGSGQTVRTYRIKGSSWRLAVSPGGDSFVTSIPGNNQGDFAQLWDTGTGNLLRTLSAANCCFDSTYPIQFTFSRDGRFILAVGGGTRVWNTSNGDFAYQLEDPAQHRTDLVSADYSPDGKLILVGYEDGTVRVWDTSSIGKGPQRVIAAHTGAVLNISFASDGNTFLTASADHTLKLWDLTTGRLLQTLTGHVDGIIDTAFSPDGKLILSADQGNSVRLWTLTGEEFTRSLVGNDREVRKMIWSPDGKTIFTVNADHTIDLWDAVSRQRIRRLSSYGEVVDIALAADSNTILIVGGAGAETAWVKDLATGRDSQHFDQNFVCGLEVGQGHTGFVAGDISPDGKLIVLAGWGATCLLDVVTGALVESFSDGQGIAAFSSDGKRLMASSGNGMFLIEDLVNNKAQNRNYYTNGTATITAGTLSPDGSMALSAGNDNSIRLWELSSHKLIQTFKGHTSTITSLAFSRDGKTFVSGSLDRTVKVWDTASGQLLRTLTGHSDTVTGVAFSPDGKLVVSASADKTVLFWDATREGWIAYGCTRVFRDLTDAERVQYGITDSEPTCPQFAL